MLKQSALALSFVLSLAACDSGTKGTEAETGAAQEVVEVAEASSYSLDQANSQVIWNGRKPGGEHHGTIAVKDGQIQLKDNKVVGGTIQMDLTQINAQDVQGEDKQKLEGHLKSPDFFYVEQYPTAKFVITSVEEFSGEISADEKPQDTENNAEYDRYVLENPTHKVTGNLTLRDTTLSITIPAKIEVKENEVTARSRFVIDRSKWNVNFMDESNVTAQAKDKFIYNKVNVGFDVVAKK